MKTSKLGLNYDVIIVYVRCIYALQVALASGFEYTEKVREAQKAIDLPNVICVDAKGLALKEDNMHLTTESQVQFGQMLAEAYLSHFHA